MNKPHNRLDIYDPQSGVVNQDRSTAPKHAPQQTPKTKPQVKQMNDGKWMVSKPSSNPGEMIRQIWDETKKKMLKEWTSQVTAKVDYRAIIKNAQEYKKAPLRSNAMKIMSKIGEIPEIEMQDFMSSASGYTATLVFGHDKQRYSITVDPMGEMNVLEGDPEFELEEIPQQ